MSTILPVAKKATLSNYNLIPGKVVSLVEIVENIPVSPEVLRKEISPVFIDKIIFSEGKNKLEKLKPDFLPFLSPLAEEVEQIDSRVFLQGKYWVDIRREFFLIENISQEYLVNILGLLKSKGFFYELQLNSKMESLADNLALYGYKEESDYLRQEITVLNSYRDTKEWLDDTILVKSIERNLLKF